MRLPAPGDTASGCFDADINIRCRTRTRSGVCVEAMYVALPSPTARGKVARGSTGLLADDAVTDWRSK